MLESFRPYLKAMVPSILAILGAIIHGLVANSWDMIEMEIMVVGLLSGLVSFATTNGTAGVARFAKSLGPALLTLAAFGIHWAFTNEFNNIELAGGLSGLLAAFVIYWVPNTSVEARDPMIEEGSDRNVAVPEGEEERLQGGRRWGAEDDRTLPPSASQSSVAGFDNPPVDDDEDDQIGRDAGNPPIRPV
jgi:hypothetical protein